MKKKSFTLIEILTTLIIIGIVGTMLFSIIFLGWVSFESEIARINLWEEANQIIDSFSINAHASASEIYSSPKKDHFFDKVIFNFLDGNFITYEVTSKGEFKVSKGISPQILSQNLVYEKSGFLKKPNSLVLKLTLEDKVFGKKIKVETSTEIFPRN